MSRIATTRIPDGFLSRGIKTWPLTIVEVTEIGRGMRRVTLGGESLHAFAYEAGNDVMVPLSEDGGPTMCRRYTIRHCDRRTARLDLDIVLHGDGIGARWAASAVVGEQVEVGGPRGKITLAKGAAWHLFAGDESAIPVTFAMMDAVPEGDSSRALLSIEDVGDELSYRVPSAGRLTWVHRAGGSTSSALVDAFLSLEIPAGPGHVYIAGEDKLVSALKGAAITRGIAADAISAKAYWSRGSRNREHGEP
jgi:NADPH-dependent ferric siderophore reductase